MKKINVEKIISVTAMPGLFKIIANGTKGVIVENITDKKRTIILNNSKIFALDTIRIYTTEEEKPIAEVLYKLYESLNAQIAPHHKTSSDDEIKLLFEKSIPNYEKEKVSIHNMRKLIQWYNILHHANMLIVMEDTANQTETKEENTIVEEVTEDSTESTPKKRGRKKKADNNE